MLGSERPEMNDDAENNSNLSSLAASIQGDFRLLVATLSHEIEQLDDPESELLAALWKAKFVAERGLRLSEHLSKSIDREAT